MIERERKLAVPASFVLPALDDLGDELTAVELTGQRLDATYYDTADLRLVRSGITVRYRTGEGRSRWTVKLPAAPEDADPDLVRREIDIVAPGKTVPAAVASLVRAHVRSAELVPVGVLRTERKRVEVRSDGEDETALVEIADDEVTVRDGRRILLRFREVEVELKGDDPAVLEAVVSRLVEAGASDVDQQTPKIVRVLGPRAQAAPEAALVELSSSSTVADVVRAAITAGLSRLLEHDPGLRLGGDDEDVHQARVASRRLRSDLRTFRSIVLPDVLGPLRDELKWLGAVLGEVRDADVLLDRLQGQAERLPATDATAAASLLGRLSEERDAARKRALAALDSERYVELLDLLAATAAAPPVEDGHLPARAALPAVVRAPWKHLQKAVESLEPHPTDEALHDVRIRAKRTRYAAEAAAGVMGKSATRFAKAIAGVQTVLGDLHDAFVAEEWLRRTAATVPADEAMVAGQLVAVQRQEMATAREEWRDAWDEASRKKLRSWLDG